MLATALAGSAIVILLARAWLNFRSNKAKVEATGLPYIIIPIGNYNPLWLFLGLPLLPLLRRLPKRWNESWIDYMTPWWCWTLLYEPFDRIGDSFFLLSWDSIFFFTADAEVIAQITAKPAAFPKPLDSYRLLNIFGRNVVSTEGEVWRTHRKILSPNLNEKNNAAVFAQSTYEAQRMVGRWREQGDGTLKAHAEDIMRLALHIITQVGFGVKLEWPGHDKEEDTDLVGSLGKGHTMSLASSIDWVLSCLPAIYFLPTWFLQIWPYKQAPVAASAWVNFRKYVRDMLVAKKSEALAGVKGDGMDILGALVKSSYSPAESSPSATADRPRLTDDEIMGNAFVMLFAGHETTSNSILFSLIELATNIEPQKEAQRQVLEILGDAEPPSWDYDTVVNELLGSMLGAILNEQLRLMPPVPLVPKSVSKTSDQTIRIGGNSVALPAGANVGLNTIGVQRNPKYWPTEESQITVRKNDLDDFRPARWLASTESTPEKAEDASTGHDIHTAGFLRTVPGSYIPFSAGPHSCLGRRLAQIEVVAVLAVIFQKYSVELAVDEWASDAEVAHMTRDGRRALYQQAQRRARATLRTASVVLTLKLTQSVPLRLVRKGQERFFDLDMRVVGEHG